MRSFVVDANVAVKWLLPAAGEPLSPQANRLLDLHVRRDLHLLAPDLLWTEIGNSLWKAVRQGRMTPTATEQSLLHFRDLMIEILPSADFLVPALQIAAAHDRSVYDSLYVALAVHAKADLITADERLVNALGSRFPVRWLGSFQP